MGEPPAGPATVVLDSLTLAGDCDSTQLPCSPGMMMHTDVVAATLKATNEFEDKACYIGFAISILYTRTQIPLYTHINIYIAYIYIHLIPYTYIYIYIYVVQGDVTPER